MIEWMVSNGWELLFAFFALNISLVLYRIANVLHDVLKELREGNGHLRALRTLTSDNRKPIDSVRSLVESIDSRIENVESKTASVFLRSLGEIVRQLTVLRMTAYTAPDEEDDNERFERRLRR